MLKNKLTSTTTTSNKIVFGREQVTKNHFYKEESRYLTFNKSEVGKIKSKILLLDRSIRHKKLLFLIYVYGQEISMHKSPILNIPSLKAGHHCWEADVNSAKLRNLFLIFMTPRIRIWSLWLKCCTEHMHWLV